MFFREGKNGDGMFINPKAERTFEFESEIDVFFFFGVVVSNVI